MKKLIILLLSLSPLIADAQTFDYDLTKATKKGAPSSLSIDVPDGNYRVSIEIGSKKRAAETTVRAENRRLFVENLTTKKGETKRVEFIVNKHSAAICDGETVRLKEREKTTFNWDDKLTLEFNGDAPAIGKIHIERDTVCPTIYLCGNSTVTDQASEPWASWGQMITRWFGTGAAVANYAESGLTAGTFLAQKRLDKIMTTLRPNDVVVCEFGHNDEKEKGPGTGAWYHYTTNLKKYIDQVRSKGASIVFCTPTQRRTFNGDGKIVNSHGDFPAAMKAVAEREQVPLIDLTALTTTFYETLGTEGSKRALVHYPKGTYPGQEKDLADNTHFNPFGAYEVAKMVATGLRRLNLPIAQQLRPEFKDFDPSHPDDYNKFKWMPSEITNTVKPDGN